MADKKDIPKRVRPARTPEGRNEQISVAAVQLAEKRIREGTASSQIICHYLKMATEKEKLELQKLQAEIKLLEAKQKAVESAEEMNKLYREAIKAMKKYTGESNEEL